jgi:ribosomal protein S18 acetylase RimI-like enzyme
MTRRSVGIGLLEAQGTIPAQEPRAKSVRVPAEFTSRPLSRVDARLFGELLEEEARFWREQLEWDYSAVRMALLRGIAERTVEGLVAQSDGRVVAYCCCLREVGRAVIGSLYASAAFRGTGLEEHLLDRVLHETKGAFGSKRIEGQTLFSTAKAADEEFTRAGFTSYRRQYLTLRLAAALDAPAHALRLTRIGRWDLDRAADLVFASHQGSLDAVVNSTYATREQCRQFVESLVLRDSCGTYDVEASFLAYGSGGPIGLILCTRLSPTNGHVCQVSVVPQAQGCGVGRVLMVSALEAFRRAGLSTASLSVTVGNERAQRLYDRLGFGVRKGFGAHAWERSGWSLGW